MRLRTVCLVTAACLACAGCGVPGAGTTQVPEAAVPYRLLEPAPSSPSSQSPSAGSPPRDGPPASVDDPASSVEVDASLAARQPTTYLLDADDLLTPAVLDPAPGTRSLAGEPGGTPDPTAVASLLVRRLGDGPTPSQRAEGLSTALGPGVPVRFDRIDGTTARVILQQPDRDPAADRLPLAAGQVVLTVTSAPGVDQVQFLRDGEPAEVPLPSGARQSAPVTAADYAPLLTTRR